MREPEKQPEQNGEHAEVEQLVEKLPDNLQFLVRRQLQQQRRGGNVNAINPDQQIQRFAERAEETMLQAFGVSLGMPS